MNAGESQFHTTRWSVVREATVNSETGRAALADLCRLYWFPIYAFLRRRGAAADDAGDLTQGFFCELIERRDFGAVSPEGGRFRAWLLVCAKNYAANDRRRAQALKRGGDRAVFSIDAEEANQRYVVEAPDADSPERVFDRLWAQSLLACALERVRADYARRGREQVFAALQPHLVGEPGSDSLSAVAEGLELTAGAVRVALHRLRGDYRTALRQEIGDTVSDPAEVSQELGALFEALGG